MTELMMGSGAAAFKGGDGDGDESLGTFYDPDMEREFALLPEDGSDYHGTSSNLIQNTIMPLINSIPSPGPILNLQFLNQRRISNFHQGPSKMSGFEPFSLPEPEEERPNQETAELGSKFEPKDIHVLLGPGKESHPGNLKLKALVSDHEEEYESATNPEKTKLSILLVKKMQESGARFLKYDRKSWSWREVPFATARRKIAHDFRNRRRGKK